MRTKIVILKKKKSRVEADGKRKGREEHEHNSHECGVCVALYTRLSFPFYCVYFYVAAAVEARLAQY
jgi:hypothetical protein